MGLHEMRTPLRHIYPHNLGSRKRQPRLRAHPPRQAKLRVERVKCHGATPTGVLEHHYIFHYQPECYAAGDIRLEKEESGAEGEEGEETCYFC